MQKTYSFQRRLLNNGTTTACYFGSLHVSGTMELVKHTVKLRQRALIGKVSMNVKNKSGYYNDTRREVDDTEIFIDKVLALGVSYFYIFTNEILKKAFITTKFLHLNVFFRMIWCPPSLLRDSRSVATMTWWTSLQW